MKAKLQIIKTTQDGEQLMIECDDFMPDKPTRIMHPPDFEHNKEWFTTEEGKTLIDYARPYLDFMDARLLEMNSRVMAANEMVRALTPEEQLAIHNVSQTLFGNVPQEEMNAIVRKAKAEVDAKEREHAEAIKQGKSLRDERKSKDHK